MYQIGDTVMHPSEGICTVAQISPMQFAGGFHLLTLLANWLKLVCLNFPFAFFTQLFFIQPLVRTVFKAIFVRKKAG